MAAALTVHYSGESPYAKYVIGPTQLTAAHAQHHHGIRRKAWRVLDSSLPRWDYKASWESESPRQ